MSSNRLWFYVFSKLYNYSNSYSIRFITKIRDAKTTIDSANSGRRITVTSKETKKRSTALASRAPFLTLGRLQSALIKSAETMPMHLR